MDLIRRREVQVNCKRRCHFLKINFQLNERRSDERRSTRERRGNVKAVLAA